MKQVMRELIEAKHYSPMEYIEELETLLKQVLHEASLSDRRSISEDLIDEIESTINESTN